MTGLSERLAALFGAEAVGRLELQHHVPGLAAEVPVLAPADAAAACEALRLAARERRRVLPAGACEHLYLGAPPGPVDFVLSARRLDRVVEYEPEDLVMRVEAGVTLHAVAAQAATHRQRLGPAPHPGRAATVGGAVAGRRSGLDRLQHGTLRDAVLGVRVAHADGTTSKAGGRVVKNVAGFDLAKLYGGSCGSLGLLLEFDLRLTARPAASALVAASLERARAREALLALRRSELQPSALLLVAGHVSPQFRVAPHRVLVLARFEGRDSTVRWQVERGLEITGGEAVPADTAARAEADLRDFLEPSPEAVHARLLVRPTAVYELVEAFESVAHVGDGFLALFGVGVVHVRLGRATTAHVETLRAQAARRHARLEVVHAPAGVDVQPAEPLPAALLALQRGIAAAFDPEARLRPAPLPGPAAGGPA